MNVPAENHGTGPLDIVIESSVCVSVTIQVVECLFTLKVFKLDYHVGVHFLHGFHELIHELLLDLERGALLSETQVQGVLQVGFVVGTAVQDNGQSLVRVNACGSRVQG